MTHLRVVATVCLAVAAVGSISACGSSGATRTQTTTVRIAANSDRTYAKGVIIPGDTVVCKGSIGGAEVAAPGLGVSSSPGPTVETNPDASVHVSCPPAEVGEGPFS